jgi:electron transport complex protein RnfB
MPPLPPSPAVAAAAPAATRADAGVPRPTTRVDAIDAVLPQTQCTRCGHDGCRPYAEAIADGDAINRCPPGGATTIAALARLTGRAIVALDPAHGEETALAVARVDEAWCIGCTLCIDACPVDAIAGGPRRMHTVLPALCTGCALCLPPCPVDCIDMIAAGRAWSGADAAAARVRVLARNRRRPIDAGAVEFAAKQERQAAVAAALQRARARRGAAAGGTP